MPFGMLDTTYIDLPAGLDVAYIEGLRTRAGVEFPQLLQEIDSRLATFNGTIDPLLAMLLMTTTELFVDGSGPVAFQVEETGEYTIARPQMVEGQAHMLPIRKYDVALGITEDGLDSMSLTKILENVDSILLGLKRLYRKLALKRLFSDAEVRIDIKTAVTSPGMAGSGTGTNVFARPYPDGQALPGGYTHYYRVASGGLAAGIKAARDRLKKWHKGPFDLIAPSTQIDAIAALPDFVSAGSALIRQGSGSAEALVDAATYVGVYDKDIRVHMAIEDTADPNIAIFKSYGNLAEQNALAWRYDEMTGRNAFLRSRETFPLANAVVLQKLGIGVNNRVAATLIRVDAAGNYVEPNFA
ncbi:MAG TPA: hypothetical protein VEY08_00945 [Chloroflexia bacterium]|nr:hypothetical protein [Chloroflexia bacterium]